MRATLRLALASVLAVVCVSAQAAAPTRYPPIRRVVTGQGADHVAKVLIDGPATNTESPRPGVVSTLLWSTDSTPAAIPIGEKPEDMGARTLATAPPPNGTRFTVIDYPPGNKPAMHRTETLDYVIVMDGEIDMDMDKSTVKLKRGDIVVQRGANHAWANRSKKPARLAFVLIDAQPLGIGHPVTGLNNPK
jgi:quercetin dioxygenase-like cupin family protein